jgi:transposase-like protein
VDGRGEGSNRGGELRGGAKISEVARRNGVARGLLTVWRHKLAAAGVIGPDFVPVRIGAESDPATAGEPGAVAPAQTRAPEMASQPAELCGMIEIEISGARIRVEQGVDPTTPPSPREESRAAAIAARRSRRGRPAARSSHRETVLVAR